MRGSYIMKSKIEKINIQKFNKLLSNNYTLYKKFCPFKNNEEWDAQRNIRYKLFNSLLIHCNALHLQKCNADNTYITITPSVKQKDYIQLTLYRIINNELVAIYDLQRNNDKQGINDLIQEIISSKIQVLEIM